MKSTETNRQFMNVIRPKELAKILSVSSTTLWRMANRGDLPPRIQLTSGVDGWLESEITEWLKRKRLAASK